MKKKNKLKPSDSIQFVKGVGAKRAQLLSSIGIHTVQDALNYLPRDWQWLGEPVNIDQLADNKTSLVQVTVIKTTLGRGLGKGTKWLDVVVSDSTGRITLRFFNGTYLMSKFKKGDRLFVFGKATGYKGKLQFINPRFFDNLEGSDAYLLNGSIYPATAKLSSQVIKAIFKNMFDDLPADAVPDHLPREYQYGFSLYHAYRAIHFPRDRAELKQALNRLKYDELLAMQLGIALRKMNQRKDTRPGMFWSKDIHMLIESKFPFELTKSQDRTMFSIGQDMMNPYPMNRLVQGDVGSGKTAVAFYAMMLAHVNKQQAVLVCPTEILARQHYATLRSLLGEEFDHDALFVSDLSTRDRRIELARIASGEARIIVGTTALLGLKFHKLGLVTFDEQHKFGVMQRAAFTEHNPHMLMLSATPIPRTLCTAILGDTQVSNIEARHERRIHTTVTDGWFDVCHDLNKHVNDGNQVYVVCPTIDGESGVLEIYGRLLKDTTMAITYLHGQQNADVKQAVIRKFNNKEVDVLVSTTVIEVGIDNPDATLMVVIDADRYGLAQLHQIRGRVGRGDKPGECLLVSDYPTENSRHRLETLTSCFNGFEIAEMDLKLRGPGQIFAMRQHGLPDLRLADVVGDYELLLEAKEDAAKMVAEWNTLSPKMHLKYRLFLEKFISDTSTFFLT